MSRLEDSAAARFWEYHACQLSVKQTLRNQRSASGNDPKETLVSNNYLIKNRIVRLLTLVDIVSTVSILSRVCLQFAY